MNAVTTTASMSACADPTSGTSLCAADPLLDRYIVVVQDTVNPDALVSEHAAQKDLIHIHTYTSGVKGYSGWLPSRHLAAIQADPRVRFVVRDEIWVQEFEQPATIADSPPNPGPQTGVQRIKAVGLQNKGTGIGVAILDTGIQQDHPDLAVNIQAALDCTVASGAPGTPADLIGHGTQVAGIVGAKPNGLVVGVAPEAKIHAVKVVTGATATLESGQTVGYTVITTTSMICALDYVNARAPNQTHPEKIHVVNMSFTYRGSDDGNCGDTYQDLPHQMICIGTERRVTFVAGAGNTPHALHNTAGLAFDRTPAAYHEVLAVTNLQDTNGEPCGTDGDDRFWSSSGYGAQEDQDHTVAGPGYVIWTTHNNAIGSNEPRYADPTGTSMSSPHVAGLAALHVKAHPNATPAETKSALKEGEPPDEPYTPPGGGPDCGEQPSHRDVTDPKRHPEDLARADAIQIQ